VFSNHVAVPPWAYPLVSWGMRETPGVVSCVSLCVALLGSLWGASLGDFRSSPPPWALRVGRELRRPAANTLGDEGTSTVLPTDGCETTDRFLAEAAGPNPIAATAITLTGA